MVEARPFEFEAVRSSLFLLCGQYYPYMLPIPDSLIPSIRRDFSSEQYHMFVTLAHLDVLILYPVSTKYEIEITQLSEMLLYNYLYIVFFRGRFPVSPDDVNIILKSVEGDPYLAIRIFEKLESQSLRVLIQYCECIIIAMKACLHEFAPLPFINSVTTVWKKLENVIPRKLFLVCFFCFQK